MLKFENMFQPITIGPMTVKNRFVVPPMGNNYANEDGSWSEQSVAYYSERAKGDFGLITIEATVVHQGAKGGKRKPTLFSDETIPSLKAVTDACHAYGAKVSIQLQNAGPEGSEAVAGRPVMAASAIIADIKKDKPVEVTTEQVYELVEGYGDAAYRAMQGGADAVEIHMAHGYLVNTFISSRTNKRTDEFGGSFENRMRFPSLIIENIRKKCGKDLALLARINASDDILGGMSEHDMAAVAAYLEELGLDALHVSRAVHLKDEKMWAPTTLHAGFSANLVTEIRQATTIPIITVGRFTEPQFAELMVKEGRADLVAFGRQSLADPHLPLKAKEGRLEDLTPCIACLQGCVANMYIGEPIRCLANPVLGYEVEDLEEADKKKKVMVIGGGVGGMCAAAVAARRGHEVDLYEAQDRLGGNMRLAAYPPGKGDITNLVRSYVVKCEKAGVSIHLNQAVDISLIEEKNPDVVIVATGSKTLLLPIEGIDDPSIIHANDILDGKRFAGEKVLVVGGGMVGCEVADFMSERGYDVTVAEFRSVIGADVIPEHRKFLMQNLEENHTEAFTNARVNKFYPDGVDYETLDGEEKSLRGFDSVVLSMGYENYNPFDEELEKSGREVYIVGDAVRARKAIDATREAYDIAKNI